MADILYETLAVDDPVSLVRALIPDIEQLDNPVDPSVQPEYIFDDNTILRYLLLNGGNVKRAAAEACDALGTSEGLILKKITTDDLATDAAGLMKEYGAKAGRLRRAALEDENLADDNSGIISTPFVRHPLAFDGQIGRYR